MQGILPNKSSKLFGRYSVHQLALFIFYRIAI